MFTGFSVYLFLLPQRTSQTHVTSLCAGENKLFSSSLLMLLVKLGAATETPSLQKNKEQSSAARRCFRRGALWYPSEPDLYLDYHISREGMLPSANLEVAQKARILFCRVDKLIRNREVLITALFSACALE